jgi:hypothetical protein
MRLRMKERRVVTKALALQYQRGGKKERGEILNHLVEMTGYNRSYAAGLLRNHGKRAEVAPGVVLEGDIRAKRATASRPSVYGPEEVKALKKVWKIMDHICGKRLAPQLSELVPRLVRQSELKASKATCEKLGRMSAATVDRLLESERKKSALKGRGGTKPGTLLKHQIPVRTFADWNEQKPGFLEIDLVAHDGGSSGGEYCQILDGTDICTGWSEQFAVPTKAQCFVFEAIKEMRERLPFPLLGLDSDNGSEFINHQLKRYCTEEEITFTRARSGRKNDNCHVEQKNWSIVRRMSGYDRFEGADACRELNNLYTVVRDYVNFFMPSMKLLEKVRDGAKVTKRHDKAQTPYQRVLASPHVSKAVKERLRKRYAALNPAALKREIEAIQKRLGKLAVRRRNDTDTPPAPSAAHPWRKSNKKEKPG